MCVYGYVQMVAVSFGCAFTPMDEKCLLVFRITKKNEWNYKSAWDNIVFVYCTRVCVCILKLRTTVLCVCKRKRIVNWRVNVTRTNAKMLVEFSQNVHIRRTLMRSWNGDNNLITDHVLQSQSIGFIPVADGVYYIFAYECVCFWGILCILWLVYICILFTCLNNCLTVY